MSVALLSVPQAAREVGYCHRCAVVVQRQGAELRYRAPLRQVVHVHVERQSVLQTIDQARRHDKVHAAVASHLLGQFAKLLQDRMVILLLQRLALRLGHETVCAEVVHLRLHAACRELLAVEGVSLDGILVGKAPRARELVETVVGLRVHHVVLQLYHLLVLRAYERRGVVSVAEVVTGLARLGLDEFLAVHALRVHGDERHHAVAAVYVKGLRHWSESVRGIEVATVVAVVFQSPSQLVGIRSVGVLPVVVP